jgi:hypothetical protein
MLNQFQESLIVAEPANKPRHPLRLTLVQAAIGLLLVIAISAFGLFTASHASGQEGMVRKATPATANVLPDLVIWPESLEPNLSGMLATGDGGAAIDAQETGEHASTRR